MATHHRTLAAVPTAVPHAPAAPAVGETEAARTKRLHWEPVRGDAAYWQRASKEEQQHAAAGLDDLAHIFGSHAVPPPPDEEPKDASAIGPPVSKTRVSLDMPVAMTLRAARANLAHVDTTRGAVVPHLQPFSPQLPEQFPTSCALASTTPSRSTSGAPPTRIYQSGLDEHHTSPLSVIALAEAEGNSPPSLKFVISASAASPPPYLSHSSTRDSSPSHKDSSNSLARSTDLLRLPSAEEELHQLTLPDVDSSRPTKLTLGEILAKEPAPTVPPRPSRTRDDHQAGEKRRVEQRRSLTPQPPSRRLSQSPSVAIDHDLMPNFLFLGRPMKAAVLPPPSPTVSTPSRSRSPSSVNRGLDEPSKAIPRNIEIGSQHAYAEPMSRSSARQWTFTSPTAGTSVVERSQVRQPADVERIEVPAPMPSPTFSPVVLGSGILNDVISTQDRVVQAMRESGGVVLIDDESLVEHVRMYRDTYAQAAQHAPGEFATRQLVKKYNTDHPGMAGHMPSSPGISPEDPQVACPFAPAQWYFNPANLPLTVTYHLVLQTINFGLADVPRDAGQTYTSLHLARDLAEVLRTTPTAFDAHALTKMNELHLGSWLQPDVFQQALRDHPSLMQEGSPHHRRRSSNLSLPFIPWTFPDLPERARLLRELGFVLLRFFNGSAVSLVEQAEHSCSRLVELLTHHLAGMRDASVYRGRFVFFYARAQGFACNLWRAFHGVSYGSFTDLADLSGQADGVLQCIFHRLGLVRYSNELRAWVNHGQDVALLPCDVEIEMRVATAYVLRRMCQLLKNLDEDVLQVQLAAWIRGHYNSQRHELKSYLPTNAPVDMRGLLQLVPLHRSSGVWY